MPRLLAAVAAIAAALSSSATARVAAVPAALSAGERVLADEAARELQTVASALQLGVPLIDVVDTNATRILTVRSPPPRADKRLCHLVGVCGASRWRTARLACRCGAGTRSVARCVVARATRTAATTSLSLPCPTSRRS